MTDIEQSAASASAASSAAKPWPVPDSYGIDRFADDSSLRSLLPLYLDDDLHQHLMPVFEDLGPRLGGELDSLAADADKNPPVLHQRNRRGEDLQSIEIHPAYRQLQEVAYGELGMAAMSHTAGVFGWPEPLPPVVKYIFFYLFAQAEFGLECPVSMTDSLTRVLRKYGSQDLIDYYLPKLTSQNLDELWQGAMFMTEQAAGSDVGQTSTIAEPNDDGTWGLTGEKWFCSNVDAKLTMVLARPAGAGGGIKGVGLFLLPSELPDGTPNSYRIVRLKDKLGTRSMPSGEVSLQGATAYLIGDIDKGFKQMASMINPSRLSNGVRAAGLMRRAFAEARFVSTNRVAFGTDLIDLPLQTRQLAKLMLTTEQALSACMHTAKIYGQSERGDTEASSALRILTPLLKFRVTRDARKVTADAMEVRGGVGYIEDFGDARVFRDAQLGSIWEGTSNIVSLDVARAAHRSSALKPLIIHLEELLAEAERRIPDFAQSAAETFASLLRRLDNISHDLLHAVERLADKVNEAETRQIATAFYNLSSAVFMAWEGAQIARTNSDFSRLVLAAMVIRHKLSPQDPLRPAVDDPELLKDLIQGSEITAERAADYVDEVLQ